MLALHQCGRLEHFDTFLKTDLPSLIDALDRVADHIIPVYRNYLDAAESRELGAALERLISRSMQNDSADGSVAACDRPRTFLQRIKRFLLQGRKRVATKFFGKRGNHRKKNTFYNMCWSAVSPVKIPGCASPHPTMLLPATKIISRLTPSAPTAIGSGVSVQTHKGANRQQRLRSRSPVNRMSHHRPLPHRRE